MSIIKGHIIRGKYKDKKRPVLINNWEAAYFAFDTEKLLAIAREASGLGIEMLVMDDGWFGRRKNEYSSLGDWYVNEEKLRGGLGYLVEEVNKLGMKFGIWFEPEMISPDSDLYRAHPDWAIAVPGRTPSMARGQYVLDFSRREVVDGVWEQMRAVLESANIEYVKWDMNRPLCDMGSFGLPPERQGQVRRGDAVLQPANLVLGRHGRHRAAGHPGGDGADLSSFRHGGPCQRLPQPCGGQIYAF